MWHYWRTGVHRQRFSRDHGVGGAMRDTMAHRGPDGGGTWVPRDGRIGLGHRRLSIIDLSSAADQPMSNEDGSCGSSSTARFTTTRDPHGAGGSPDGIAGRPITPTQKMILHAFEEWGIDCLDRFRGMFAIALWEDKRGASGWCVTASASSRSITACTRAHYLRLGDQGPAEGPRAAARSR